MSINYKILLVAALAVFMPLKPVLAVVAILVAASHGSTLLVSRKQGQAILPYLESKKFVVKLSSYIFIVALAFLTEQYLTGEIVPIVKILSGYIGMEELKRTTGNIEALTGVPLLSALVERLAQANTPNPPPGV